MSTGEILEVEAIEPAPLATLHGTSDPTAITRRAAEQARVLMQLVRERGLARRFGNSEHEHLSIEAWSFLGATCGLTAAIAWTRRIEDDGITWEARAEIRTLDGRTVGAAESMCSSAEANWRRRDAYAIRSMAQTRASSKALRLVVGWIAAVAGFDASLSAEEASVELGAEPATDPQKQKLAILAHELGWGDEERRSRAGVASFRELTRDQAHELIETWQELLGVQPGSAPPESLEELWNEAAELYGSRARVVRAVARARPGEALTVEEITAGDLQGALAAWHEEARPA